MLSRLREDMKAAMKSKDGKLAQQIANDLLP